MINFVTLEAFAMTCLKNEYLNGVHFHQFKYNPEPLLSATHWLENFISSVRDWLTIVPEGLLRP